MKSLLSHIPIVLKQMIGLPAFILVGCVVCAWLILTEFGSITSHRPSPGARLPTEEIKPAAPEIRKLADPLFNPTLRRPETASSANDFRRSCGRGLSTWCAALSRSEMPV